MDELMSIGEFSACSGLSPKRLRNYASAGLLVPAAVDAMSGYRYYAPGQIHEARVIELLRRAGIPVGQIGAFLAKPTVEQFERWEHALVDEMRRRHEALMTAGDLLALDAIPRATDEMPRDSGGADMRTIVAAAATDTGRVRTENEDAVLISDVLAAVADGLGGHAAGEVASRIAVEALRDAFTGHSLDDLEDAVRTANTTVWEQARADAELEGMGTTLCAAGLVEGSKLGVVNVGDSRAYLVRDGTITRITEDHNVVGDLIKRGELTEPEAAEHPYRNVLTRAIGCGPTVDPDAFLLSPREGDRLLLCTDGLFNELADTEIAAVLVAAPDSGRAAQQLVSRAVTAGGQDNVSAVVVDFPSVDGQAKTED